MRPRTVRVRGLALLRPRREGPRADARERVPPVWRHTVGAWGRSARARVRLGARARLSRIPRGFRAIQDG